MNRGPLVGVTMSMTIDATPERAYVNSAYLHAVQQAGGVPVLLPPQLSAASLERLSRGLDALLLTGGGDMDPSHFGESPHPTLYEVVPARDMLELGDDTRWVLGVQWHPEHLTKDSEPARRLFAALVTAART